MKTGIELIADERERQVKELQHYSHRDDDYRSGELNDAGVSYAQAAAYQARGQSLEYIKSIIGVEVYWPWEDHHWKPSEDPVRNLVKAAALLVAEIDRILRTRD